MDDLYRHFLVDDMPEEDDCDEDFKPLAAEDDEECEEAGVRSRNIQSRELSDLLHDAFKQLGPPAIPPGLREKVLDQLSMHFQQLVQTGILSVKAACPEEELKTLGMLQHLANAPCKGGNGRRRTRVSRNSSVHSSTGAGFERLMLRMPSHFWNAHGTPRIVVWCDPLGDGLPSVGVPGLLPGNTIEFDMKDAGEIHHPHGNPEQAVERLMESRGGVVWPQLFPGEMLGGVSWYVKDSGGGTSVHDNFHAPTSTLGPTEAVAAQRKRRGKQPRHQASRMLPSSPSSSLRPRSFSMVEDRLLCRGIHVYNVDWNAIKANMLPHKSTGVIMTRYAALSGWAALNGTVCGKPIPQMCAALWTVDEDLMLRNAVETFGKKWARIAREVLPRRGRESLRSRWTFLQERVASVLVSPQPAAQWGPAEETPGQGGGHGVSYPQPAAASEDTAGALSGGIEAMGKGWCIPPPKHSSTEYARVQSLGNVVSGCTPARGTEWAIDSGHAPSTCIEPIGGSVAFLAKPSLNGVPSASAYDRPIADPRCCDMTVVARDWATSTEKRRMFGSSAVYPIGCISTVPPTRLLHVPTSAPAQRAGTQPEMVTQQRAGQIRIHDVPPAVDRAQEKDASPSTHFDGITQRRGKVTDACDPRLQPCPAKSEPSSGMLTDTCGARPAMAISPGTALGPAAWSGYAEDELSDDANNCPNGPARRTCGVEPFVEDMKRDMMEHSGSAERRISKRSGHPFGGECLFDEDELSDAEY